MDFTDNLIAEYEQPAFDFIFADVTSEIDILTDAPRKFLSIVAKIETAKNDKAKANIAKQYIEEVNSIKVIDYKVLGGYLQDYASCPIQVWRQLYLLERSIPSRFGTRYTWVQRLKIFYNTFVNESNVVGASFNGHKLYYIRGNSNNPIRHDALVYGVGQPAADFYYYDDTIQGGTTNKMVKVEFKYCAESTPQAGAEKYATGRYTYGAKYVILYMANTKSYVMVDYNKYPASGCITELNIPAPVGLLEI